MIFSSIYSRSKSQTGFMVCPEMISHGGIFFEQAEHAVYDVDIKVVLSGNGMLSGMAQLPSGLIQDSIYAIRVWAKGRKDAEIKALSEAEEHHATYSDHFKLKIMNIERMDR